MIEYEFKNKTSIFKSFKIKKWIIPENNATQFLQWILCQGRLAKLFFLNSPPKKSDRILQKKLLKKSLLKQILLKF